MKKVSTSKLLTLILALGFLLKLTILIYRGDIDITGDSVEYNGLAMGIINNFSYIDLSWSPYFRSPGYPLFLSILYLFSPQNFILVKFVHIIISIFTAYTLFKIGKLIFSEKVGILTAFIFTFHPYAIEQCLHLKTAHLFMLLSSSSIYFLLKYNESGSENKIRALVFSGIFIALGTLTRPSFVLLLPIVVIWFYLKNRRTHEILKSCLVLFFSFSLTLSPWVIRNYIKYDEFIWGAPAGGYNFWIANSAEQHEALTTDSRERYLYLDRGGLYVDKAIRVYKKLEKDFNYSKLSPKAQERLWYREAFVYIKNNPRDYMELVAYKILNYLRPWLKPWAYPTKYVLASGVINIPILILGLTGLIIALRSFEHRHNALLLLLFFLSCIFTHSIFTTQTRYRFIEVDIFLFIFVSHLIFILRQSWKNTGGRVN